MNKNKQDKRIVELRNYFKTNVGPVFCTPTTELLHRYSKMKDCVGVIRPWTPDQIRCNARLTSVDWTLNKNWEELSNSYSAFAQAACTIDEINLIKPGTDIPQIADEAFPDWDWKPSKLGDVVCISQRRHTTYAENYPEFAIQYIELMPYIGVVVEKCSNIETSIMITFTVENNEIKAINVPIEILVKLPESFRPSSMQKKVASTVKASTPDFKVGQVIRVSSAVADENFMGLVGVVEKVHEVKPRTEFKKTSDWEYTVDFNLLPNRNLSICEGENGHTDIITVTRLEERDLDEWDEKVSDKPYFSLHRAYSKRARVWVPHKQNFGYVKTKSGAKKSLGEGIKIKVEIDSATYDMTCRDVDYRWDPDALRAALSNSFICLGVEEDDRNPNVVAQQYVYMYIFDYGKDIGKYVQYRILLGTLLRKPATCKKFARALLTEKLTHPWHVHRYLKQKSLGYFYQLMTAKEWLEKIGEFTYAE